MKFLLQLCGVSSVIVAVAGCSVIGLDDTQEVLGWVQDASDIMMPDTFQLGVFEAVHFNTGGSSSCTISVDTEVSVRGLLVTITPIVKQRDPRNGCTDDLRYFGHRARFRFAEPGDGVVRIRTRVPSLARDTLLEYAVHVRR
jgi:hypothetical protein